MNMEEALQLKDHIGMVSLNYMDSVDIGQFLSLDSLREQQILHTVGEVLVQNILQDMLEVDRSDLLVD